MDREAPGEGARSYNGIGAGATFSKTLRQVAPYAGRRTAPPTPQVRHRLTTMQKII